MTIKEWLTFKGKTPGATAKSDASYKFAFQVQSSNTQLPPLVGCNMPPADILAEAEKNPSLSIAYLDNQVLFLLLPRATLPGYRVCSCAFASKTAAEQIPAQWTMPTVKTQFERTISHPKMDQDPKTLNVQYALLLRLDVSAASSALKLTGDALANALHKAYFPGVREVFREPANYYTHIDRYNQQPIPVINPETEQFDPFQL